MDNKAKIKFISIEELERNKDKYLILDIREPGRFSQGSIEGSIHIASYNDLKIGNLEKVKEKYKILPKDRPIVTVCNAGITAQIASLILEEMGYESLVLEDGMIGYLNAFH